MWAFRASATTGTDSTLGTYVVMPLANQIYRPYECELLRGFHCRQGTAYLFKVVHSVVETHNYGDIHESDDDWLPAESSKRGKSMSRNQKLFEISVNILVGPKEDRLMTTGLHTVSDIFCICCNQIVGWKYVSYYERFRACKLVKDGCYEVLNSLYKIIHRTKHMNSAKSTRKENLYWSWQKHLVAVETSVNSFWNLTQ